MQAFSVIFHNLLRCHNFVVITCFVESRVRKPFDKFYHKFYHVIFHSVGGLPLPKHILSLQLIAFQTRNLGTDIHFSDITFRLSDHAYNGLSFKNVSRI